MTLAIMDDGQYVEIFARKKISSRVGFEKYSKEAVYNDESSSARR